MEERLSKLVTRISWLIFRSPKSTQILWDKQWVCINSVISMLIFIVKAIIIYTAYAQYWEHIVVKIFSICVRKFCKINNIYVIMLPPVGLWWGKVCNHKTVCNKLLHTIPRMAMLSCLHFQSAFALQFVIILLHTIPQMAKLCNISLWLWMEKHIKSCGFLPLLYVWVGICVKYVVSYCLSLRLLACAEKMKRMTSNDILERLIFLTCTGTCTCRIIFASTHTRNMKNTEASYQLLSLQVLSNVQGRNKHQ
jgi:hypothetical protein